MIIFITTEQDPVKNSPGTDHTHTHTHTNTHTHIMIQKPPRFRKNTNKSCRLVGYFTMA